MKTCRGYLQPKVEKSVAHFGDAYLFDNTVNADGLSDEVFCLLC